MATIRKIPSGKWRAEVFRRGVRRSKAFPTKQAAKDWAAREEHLILNAEAIRDKTPLADVLARYGREVSVTKRGERWEVARLAAMAADKIGKIAIGDLTPEDLGEWRDRRLRLVAPGTVRREITLLSAVLNTARREWRLLKVNPMSDVRRPVEPAPRDRLPTDDEIARLAHSAGDDLGNATARAFHAFLFAMQTAMRAGEIVGLRREHVDTEKRIAVLPRTKNGTRRDVPLSTEAVRLIEALPDDDPIFGLSSSQLESLWRKLRDRAGVSGLTFHDSRHAAITRLAKKLDVLALARMVGHKDIRQLQVYFNESAADMAARLD